MVKLVVDDEIVVGCHQPVRTVLANLDVAKALFELVLRRREEFYKAIELARANAIELSVVFARAVDLCLGIGVMKEHIRIQQELRYGIPVLADDVLAEFLQHAANLRDVIGIGLDFETLRHCWTSPHAREESDEGDAHGLVVHMTFPLTLRLV